MYLPPELLIPIVREVSDDPCTSPLLRRQTLFALLRVSRFVASLAEPELLRRVVVDGGASIGWVEKKLEGKEGAEVKVEEVVVVFPSTAAKEESEEDGVEAQRVAELLRQCGALSSLTIETRSSTMGRQTVGTELLEKVDCRRTSPFPSSRPPVLTAVLADLTHLSLTNISLTFPSTFPVFPSLVFLTLHNSRFTLPPPFDACTVLPHSSLPVLETLVVGEIPGVDVVRNEEVKMKTASRFPLYSVRDLMPFVKQLEGAGKSAAIGERTK